MIVRRVVFFAKKKFYSYICEAIYQTDTWRDDKTDTLYASDIIMEFK